jgi:hypothetical protein
LRHKVHFGAKSAFEVSLPCAHSLELVWWKARPSRTPVKSGELLLCSEDGPIVLDATIDPAARLLTPVPMLCLNRHLHGRHMGRTSFVVLHRLQAMVRARRSVVTSGLGEKLIGRNGGLMIFRRRDVTRYLCIFGSALIMATAVELLPRIAIMGLSQCKIFAGRRSRNVAMMIPGVISMSEIVHVLE